MISTGATRHSAHTASAAGTAFCIPAVEEGFGTVCIRHGRDFAVGERMAVRIKPGPVLCIGQAGDVGLQALLKLSQIQIQVAAVITVGIGMPVCVIFDRQCHGTGKCSVTVKIKANVHFVNSQPFDIDVLHVLSCQILRQLFLEVGVKAVGAVQIVLESQGHIRFGQRGDGTVGHAAPKSVGEFDLFTVHRDGCAVAAVCVGVDSHSARCSFIRIEVRIVGGGCQHRGMRTAARTACGDEVVHTAGEITKQDVVFHETHGVLLIDQTGRRVTGVSTVRQCALFAAVAAGHIDVAFGGIGGACGLVGLRGVARRAGIDDHGSGSCGIDLPVGAGDRGVVIDDQAAAGRARGHIGHSVAISVNAFDVSARYRDGHALVVRQFCVGDCSNGTHRPGVGVLGISPGRTDVPEIQRSFDGFFVTALCCNNGCFCALGHRSLRAGCVCRC